MVLTAGGDFPAINQGCVAHHGDIIYEVGGQAHVVGNHPQTCSHRRERGVVGPDNGGVMLRQRRDARIGVVDQTAEPSRPGRTIAAENLATAVKDNFGASRTCSPGGSLRWRQRSARCPPARSARVPVAGRHRAHRRRDVSEAPSAAVSNAVGVDPPLRQLIGKPTATSAFAASLRARRSCSPASPGLPGA